MPVIGAPRTGYEPRKERTVSWNTFKGGLNTLLNPQELDADELAQADNLVLVGSGIPTKRWGSENYFLGGATGAVRGIGGYYGTDGSNDLLSITDAGYLNKKSGASYTQLSGMSWSSGYDASMEQLNDNMYVINGVESFAKYNGSSIETYTQLSRPTGLTATNFSGATGSITYSWRVSAESETGETLAANSVMLENMPQDISDTLVKLSWTTSSPASDVVGYNIYGRNPGYEAYIDRVDASSLSYDDDGSAEEATLAEPPTADTTGGPVAKYIIKFKNRLILGGIEDNPSRVMISGTGTNAERFHWSQEGGYIDIDKDSGDEVTGLGLFGDSIIVYKEKSIWQLTISTQSLGNLTIINPTYKAVTQAHGCVSDKTIQPVENDVFFLSRNGVFALGYEPNILNVIRTNEISARIRPNMEGINYSDKEGASAVYTDKKYIISFPTRKETYVYDRERMSWTGPWNTTFGINNWLNYYDSSGKKHILTGDYDDSYVSEFKAGLKSDKGSAFDTILRTRKEDFDDWSFFKEIRDIFLNLKNVSGDVDVNASIEDREGNTVTASSFSISSQAAESGWGADLWAEAQWGDTNEDGEVVSINDLVKWIILNKTARSIQLEITTNVANDNYELLALKIKGKPERRGVRPLSWTQ